MGIKDGYSFEQVYDDYLAWFHERAVPTAMPKDREDVMQYQLCNEDVYEDEETLLNRMYFFIPLLPSESKNGKPQVFIIEELNLMKKANGDPEDIEDFMPVEYTKYIY